MQSTSQAELAVMTVNDVIARFPGTLPVFDAFGIDSCCGGSLAVEEVVRRHGIDHLALLTALAGIAAANGHTAAGG